MKKILLLILLANICCIGLYSQSENIFKTVEYAIGEHSDDDIVSQSLTYTLENGGLHIKGYMMTNCGGIHFMNCLIVGGNIFLSRAEMGFLFDCDFWHYVDFVIDGIPEGYYQVHLQQYGCDPETADYAEISTNTISLVKDKDYSCEYSDGQYAITLHDAAAFSDAQIKVFDCNGKPVWESTFTGSTLYIPSQDKLSICKMIINGKDYTMKMIGY